MYYGLLSRRALGGGASGFGVHPPGGALNGMPMLANAARAATGGQTPIIPRFDLRPSVIPHSPAAG